MLNCVYKKREREKRGRGGGERIRSGQSASARVPSSGTWHTRVPVSLALARAHRRRLYATLFTRVFIHTALQTTMRGRTTRTKVRRQESESWWLPSGAYIQQVISRHFRRHFYFRDTATSAIRLRKPGLIAKRAQMSFTKSRRAKF